MTQWEKMAIRSIKEIQKKYFTDNTPKTNKRKSRGSK